MFEKSNVLDGKTNSIFRKVFMPVLVLISWIVIGVLTHAYYNEIHHYMNSIKQPNHELLLSLNVPLPPKSAPKPAKKLSSFSTLIFDEEFDTLNLSIWQHVISLYGGGNWEFEYYTNNRSNSYVRNSTLFIKPTLTNNTYTAPGFLTSGTVDLWGSTPADQCTSNFDYGCFRSGTGCDVVNPVQSARLRTVNSFSFKYGKISIRAQLPQGDWLWPAIWMIPKHNMYGAWPASGEIDIIEARGNKKLTTSANYMDGDSIGVSSMYSTLHWGPYYGSDSYYLTHNNYTLSDGYLSDDFHVWTLEWTPSGIIGYIDDTSNVYFNHTTPSNGYWNYGNFETRYPGSLNPWEYGNIDAPFDQEFFIVLNVAAGGISGFFPDGSMSSPGDGSPDYVKPWSDSSSCASSEFWNDVNSWYPTWKPFSNNGESAALKIDYIKVWSYDQ